jgi:hypothetical protein
MSLVGQFGKIWFSHGFCLAPELTIWANRKCVFPGDLLGLLARWRQTATFWSGLETGPCWRAASWAGGSESVNKTNKRGIHLDLKRKRQYLHDLHTVRGNQLSFCALLGEPPGLEHYTIAFSTCASRFSVYFGDFCAGHQGHIRFGYQRVYFHQISRVCGNSMSVSAIRKWRNWVQQRTMEFRLSIEKGISLNATLMWRRRAKRRQKE